jgi:hypothetical protein
MLFVPTQRFLSFDIVNEEDMAWHPCIGYAGSISYRVAVTTWYQALLSAEKKALYIP